MPERPPPDPRELGVHYTIAQVGLEMVAPAGLGAVLDHYLGWSPWGVVVGAVLGLVTGIAHLVALSNRQDRRERLNKPRQEPP
jgi:F0F1-type ATP synthase assembly protein I